MNYYFYVPHCGHNELAGVGGGNTECWTDTRSHGLSSDPGLWLGSPALVKIRESLGRKRNWSALCFP